MIHLLLFIKNVEKEKMEHIKSLKDSGFEKAFGEIYLSDWQLPKI